MRCPHCDHTIPANAQYCIFCAAPVTPVMPAPPVVDTVAPATGPTQRLGPLPTPRPMPMPTLTPVQPPRRHGARQSGKDASGQIWWIGLLVLLFTGFWWPGILILLGITGFVREQARGRRDKALQSLLVFGGLTLVLGGRGLLTFGAFFASPFLLILGVMLPFILWSAFHGR